MTLNYLEGLRRTFRVYLAVSALIAVVVVGFAIANTPRCKESFAAPAVVTPQMRESLGVPGLVKGILDAKAGGHSDDEIFRNLPMTKYAPAMKSARQAGLKDDQIAEILGLRLQAPVIDTA